MTHRFRVLDDLESQLREATARPETAPLAAVSARRGRRLVLLLALVGLLLGGAAIALAASGVILTGAAVPAPRFASPTVGAGLPQAGRSWLLPLRVPDPAGGPPWAMRAVRTTRGLLCVQLGRVQAGVLGELGMDGVFHGDGRFHPVGPSVLPTYTGGAPDGGAMTERGSCVLAYGDVSGNGEAWGSAVVGEIQGTDENAALATGDRHVAASHRRQILYGILGPHAVSVTYRSGGGVHVVPVVKGIGAFLIVLPDHSARHSEEHGEAPGTDTPGEGPGTVGPLVKISYDEHGHICENGSDAETGGAARVTHACPPPNPYPPSLRVTPPGSFTVTPRVALQTSHHRVLGALVSFTAPFAVTSAAEEYTVTTTACGPHAEGLQTEVLDRNVVAGETVRIALPYPFAAPCARRGLRVQVIYQAAGPLAKRSYGRAPGELIIGSAPVALPHGDRAARPPLRSRR